ncbi:Lipoteichoic acid synthase 1 [Stutzerimonas frequens]|jgi:phosphoglycerol transferase MdoB-like AlkP superfamily enzyme|uniref:LTA synthase family protein n=1 Tax=Stutzerimonas frequens TaxID=2968969 RepID=UPI001269434B|nr:LTA synthase family protein [Stutzerimonas frequens]NCT77322.1 sulfatase-like hydrolase/transferase [Stutzerimonas stutzeri]QFU11208.1 Lipoteichoic acid synthase 1 [Stutzerimonas frequens]|tara:strand:+ start:2246 stop:4399 length:2154 start_codon:yes stop_codon:yes gene_type:complete
MTDGTARAQAGQPGLRHHLLFMAGSALALLMLFTLLRLALLLYNRELLGDASLATLLEGFGNGLRFDLRLLVYICVPLSLAVLSRRAMAARRLQRLWLAACASLVILLGMVELNFYQEFHQRLNSLVFQYLAEDPATVLSMLWHGFPVLTLLSVWGGLTLIWSLLFGWLDRRCRPRAGLLTKRSTAPMQLSWHWHGATLVALVLISVVAARGTLRQGPPLRWGDAFTTDSVFINQLGLNPALTLYEEAKNRYSDHRDNAWKAVLPEDEALAVTRALLLTGNDRLADPELAAVRRDYRAPEAGRLPVRNVVVILMESFAGRYVGALGSRDGITPHFDRLAAEGLLFERFFANGTHTHQGMFASMACFPNLPGFEYLMQSPEGGNRFSGLPQLLSARAFNDVYVYNGDFAWDNQLGFFGNQGMTRFVGRNDYIDPVVADPTWGVSDQDMFDRAVQELGALAPGEPFYALLQTLSNHTPYALPDPLPVPAVSGHGSQDAHLTAMRYSDWALGRFFEQAKRQPWYQDTLFVVVGDHGFGAPEQLTEMDLFRFHVPLLLIAPGVTEQFGSRREVVGTQVDVVPTIMGRLGGEVRHQCWGRDLLALDERDPGFGIIKPSGSDQTVAMIRGEQILVQPKDLEPRLYRYRLGADASAQRVADAASTAPMLRQLQAYLQVATASLLANSAGDRERKEPETGQKLARAGGGQQVVLPAPGARQPREG